jgi:hypothetical protein
MADSAPQKCRAITDLKRRNIHRRRDTTSETQKELIAWFAAQPSGRPLTQGQISIILSLTYAYLDTDPRTTLQLVSKRRFNGDYPHLEDALFHLQQQMQKKKAIITGDILRAQVHQIWNLNSCIKLEKVMFYEKFGPVHGFVKRKIWSL